MANEVRIRATADTKQAQQSVTGLRKTWKDFQSEASKSALGQGAGFALASKGLDIIGASALHAGQAIGDFIHDSIGAASDLNETLSKSQVVFGSSASGIEEWGKTAATSMGMSENAAIGAAASIGNLLQATGTAKSKIAPMSEGIVQLASDLASFNNISIEDALAKLQSGLVGEARPLRELGVAISEASVKAKAAALGFHAVNGEFTEGQKVQARYALIFEQTKTAQGDFARTSDQLANSQRTLSAEWEDAQAKIGQELLPVAIEFVHVLNKDLIPATDTLIGLWKAAGDAAGTLSGILDTAAGSTKDAADQADFLGSKTSPLGQLLHGVAGAVGDLADDLRGVPRASERAATELTRFGDASTNSAEKTKGAFAQFGDTSTTAAEKTKGAFGMIAGAAGGAQEDVTAAFDKMKSDSASFTHDVIADAQKIVDDYFDVLIAHDELAATNAEISALRRKVAAGTATKEEIAQLHKAEQTQKELLSDLASHGKTQDKEYEKAMKGLLSRLKSAHGDERAAILAEIKALELLAAKAQLAKSGVLGAVAAVGEAAATLAGAVSGKAVGGPVQSHTPYVVGERGPELFVPSASGSIVPNDQLASGGGNVTVILPQGAIVVQGIATPAVLNQIERDLGPIIARVVARTKR